MSSICVTRRDDRVNTISFIIIILNKLLFLLKICIYRYRLFFFFFFNTLCGDIKRINEKYYKNIRDMRRISRFHVCNLRTVYEKY